MRLNDAVLVHRNQRFHLIADRTEDFEALRELLLAPPLGAKRVMGIDPGFRTGCKVAVVDGRVAYVGGHNVGDEYLGKDPMLSPWRDTHVALRGPVAERRVDRGDRHARRRIRPVGQRVAGPLRPGPRSALRGLSCVLRRTLPVENDFLGRSVPRGHKAAGL